MRFQPERVLIAAAVVMLGAASHHAGTRSRLASGVERALTHYAGRGHFNGSALVAAGGEVLFKRGYGAANLEWDIANTPGTVFRIGSVSKPFTAVLTMQLVDEGKITLGTTLSDVLPWYRPDTGRRVTIERLLTHTGGIPFFMPEGIFCEDRNAPLSVKDLVQRFHSGDLEYEPGTEFRYSNSDYVILGAVIEEVTGKPYGQVLEERVLRPASMQNTGLDYPGKIVPGRAYGYSSTPEGPRGEAFFNISFTHGAGGLYSTVEDIYRWDRALYGKALLSEASRERMFTPGINEYNLGWLVRRVPIGPDLEERTVARHAGDVLGFHALVVRVLEDRHLIVLLANMDGAPLQEIAADILDVLYGREPGSS